MTPGDFPLTLYHGDTYRWTFVLWADADKTLPADLANVTVKAEIRDKPGGAKVTPLATTIIQPNAILLEIDAETSKAIPLAGAWDLQLTYATGEVATVLAGVVAVTMDVTDSAVPAPAPLTLIPITPVAALPPPVAISVPNRGGRVVLAQ
jgi:hypothetical protein